MVNATGSAGQLEDLLGLLEGRLEIVASFGEHFAAIFGGVPSDVRAMVNTLERARKALSEGETSLTEPELEELISLFTEEERRIALVDGVLQFSADALEGEWKRISRLHGVLSK